MRLLPLALFILLLVSTQMHILHADEGVNFSTLFHLPEYIPVSSKAGADISGSEFYIYVRNLGGEADFRVSYFLSPRTDNISILFKPETFRLKSGERKYIFVTFKILPGTIPGIYNVKIVVEGKIGNVASASGVEIVIEVFGGEFYIVDVFTGLRDNTGVPAKILVDVVRNGKRFTVFEDVGPKARFYLVKGEYYFSAIYLGKKFAEERVFVEKNFTEVKLFLDLIRVVSFEVERVPKIYTDPLIYKIKVVSLSEAIRRKNVTVNIKLNISGETKRYNIGTYEINGRQTLTIRGYIDPPGTWKNGTYSLSIELSSQNTILSRYSVEIKVFVRVPQPPQGAKTNIITLAMASVMGAISGALLSIIVTRTRKHKPEFEKKHWLYKVLILGKEKPIFIYDVLDSKPREDLLADDRYLLVTSMMGVLITIVKERLEIAEGSFTIHDKKYIYRELENEFYLILEVEKFVDEDSRNVRMLLDKLSDYINERHRENKVVSPEFIVSTRRYMKIIGDLKAVIDNVIEKT